MKHEIKSVDFSQHNDVISKLVADYQVDAGILNQCLDLLGKLAVQPTSSYLFNNGSRGTSTELSDSKTIEIRLSRDYWMKFFEALPLHQITNKTRLAEVREVLFHGEIEPFSYENVQNLIQQLYIEKFKVNAAGLVENLGALSSLSIQPGAEATAMLSEVRIQNVYTVSHQGQDEVFTCIDAIRLALREDLHQPEHIIPFSVLLQYAHKTGQEWVSVDGDLLRFKQNANGSTEIVLSHGAMNILEKNMHGVSGQTVLHAEGYDSVITDQFKWFYSDELTVLEKILKHCDQIDENDELKLPYEASDDALVLLSLALSWAFSNKSLKLEQAKQEGYTLLKINTEVINEFIRTIYLGGWIRADVPKEKALVSERRDKRKANPKPKVKQKGYDVSKLNNPEYFAHLNLFAVCEEMKNCDHKFIFSYNYKFPFVRFNQGERYITNITCGLYKCETCGFGMLKKPYFAD